MQKLQNSIRIWWGMIAVLTSEHLSVAEKSAFADILGRAFSYHLEYTLFALQRKVLL